MRIELSMIQQKILQLLHSITIMKLGIFYLKLT